MGNHENSDRGTGINQRGTGPEQRGEETLAPRRPAKNKPFTIFSQKAEFAAEMPPELQSRLLILDNFVFSKSSLISQHVVEIDDLVKDLLKTSKKYDNRLKVNISLVGHTDHVGTDDYNFDLGMLRAIAVRQQLQNKLKVQLGNLLSITVSTKGKSKPVASNGTDQGRAMNRRVEVNVNVNLLRAPVPKKKHKRVPPPPPQPEPPKKISKACYELKKMSGFAKIYLDLKQSANDTLLGIDKDGKLTFEKVPPNYLDLLSQKTQDKVEGFLKDKLKVDKNIMFKSHFLPVIEALSLLNDIRAMESDRQLVGGTGKKWKKKQFQKKLSMFLDIMANDRYQNLDPVRARGTTPGSIKLEIWKKYKRFEKLQSLCRDPKEGQKIMKRSH